MRAPERLTIDANIARDFLDPDRPGNSRAVELFGLARTGDVELAAASSGYIVDMDGDLAEQVRAMFADENVTETTQLAYPGLFYPGGAYPGAGVPVLVDAWNEVLTNWKSHEGAKPSENDRVHVETHVLTGRDVFITDDKGLRVMCRRLRDEHGFAIDAVDLAGYLARRRA